MFGIGFARGAVALSAAVVALGCAVPAWSRDSGQGARPMRETGADATVLLHLCNKTGSKVYVALSYRPDDDSDDWIVEGWHNVAPYSCVDKRVPNTSVVYDYAEDDSDHYWGGDFNLCVQYPGPFSRVNTSGYTCSSNELKGFSEDDVTGLSEANINYNP